MCSRTGVEHGFGVGRGIAADLFIASDLIPPSYGSGERCAPPAPVRCSASLRARFRGDPPHDGGFAQP